MLELDPAGPLYATVFACPSDFRAFDSVPKCWRMAGLRWFEVAVRVGAVGSKRFSVVAGVKSQGAGVPQGLVVPGSTPSLPYHTFPFHNVCRSG